MKLADLQKQLDVGLEEMIELVEETLHEGEYTKEEVARVLGVSVERLEEISFTSNTRNFDGLKLRQRALHVFKGNMCKIR